jgi:hypothetical protein
MKRSALVLTVVLPALALVACGSSKSSTTASAPTTATSAVSTATVTRTVTGSTTKPTPTGPALCRASTLTLSFLGQQGAAGHGELGFALKNTGSATCHTSGFPGILWLDKSGNGLPTNPKHVTTDMAGSVPVVSLNVGPGATVSFRLFVTHGAVPGLPCTTAAALQVIPPNDTATLRVSIPGGAFECKDTTVSPLRPGTSAFTG